MERVLWYSQFQKYIYLIGMHTLKILLSGEEMWNICGCTLFPYHGFLSHCIFPWQSFNEATKSTHMIDTQGKY